jgi:hypothetical protein
MRLPGSSAVGGGLVVAPWPVLKKEAPAAWCSVVLYEYLKVAVSGMAAMVRGCSPTVTASHPNKITGILKIATLKRKKTYLD